MYVMYVMLCYELLKQTNTMLNDDGNENGKKYQLFLLAKKSFTSAARFLVHVFDVVLQHDNVRRLSYTSYIGNVVCAHHNFCCLCPWSPFFFTAAHCHLAGR